MAVVISEGLFYFCYLSCTVIILSGKSVSAQNSTSTEIPSAETTTMLNTSVSFTSSSGFSPSATSDMAMSTKDLGSEMTITLSPSISTIQVSDSTGSSESIISNSDTHLSSHSFLSSKIVPTSVSVTMNSSSNSLIMQVNETSTLKIDVNTQSTYMTATDSVENTTTTALQTSMPQTDSIENTITTAVETSMPQTNIIENTMTTALQTSMPQTNIIENTMTTDLQTSTLQTDSMEDSTMTTIFQTSSLEILNTDSKSSMYSSGISIIASVDSLVSADMSSDTEIFSNTLTVEVTESSTIHLEPSNSVTSVSVSSTYLSHDLTSLSATATAMMSDSQTIVQTNSLDGVDSSFSMASDINTEQLTTTIHPTMSTDFMVSSSVLPITSTPTTTTTTPKTTTTTKPPTTTLNQTVDKELDDSNVFEIPTVFTMTKESCINKTSDSDLRKYVLSALLVGIDEIRDVIVIRNPCKYSRRRKRAVDNEAEVNTTVRANSKPSEVVGEIVSAFEKSSVFNLTDAANFNRTAQDIFQNPCNSDICSGYFGYICTSKNDNKGWVECSSRCISRDCSNHGSCKIVVTSTNDFGTQCVCDSEEYYKYEGSDCEMKRMKWELAVAIAAGSLGAIIVILIFILIIYCCCKNKEDKYEYRGHSYEPMSEVRGRPGPAYYRNEGIKSQPAGYPNFGYEDDQFSDISDPSQRQMKESSWNPEKSKDTYAKISEKLEKENNFHIKRPQVSSIRQSVTGEATTGF